jgi:deoxyribodipyrimidine photo-lyase
MKNSLVLFNQDLRIIDNPALFEALKNSQNILPIFILDEINARPIGEASKWFLHHALESLQKELKEKFNLNLIVKKGNSLEILKDVFAKEKINEIYFNKLLEPYNVTLQNQIVKLAKASEIAVFFFKSQTLFDPSEIKNGAGEFYKVFTPFWKECLRNSSKIEPILDCHALLRRTRNDGDDLDCAPLNEARNDSEPSQSSSPARSALATKQFSFPTSSPASSALATKQFSLEIKELNLLPKINWDLGFKNHWQFCHQKLRENLVKFLENKLTNYKEARDFPALESTSKLSPYLHFGMISPREIFNLAMKFPESKGKAHFLSELGWREFSHHLIFYFPNLGKENYNKKFNNFPWFEDENFLKKWQKGQTGFPIVDAGMRELWATGWMHNRVRMIVASFLIKDLLIDWRQGEKWFWNCLFDANLANNAASWQWVAGCGFDAAPYFRIFNPILQGEKFDPEGIYVKKWVPELKNLPAKFIHKPFEMDEKQLKLYGLELGKTYPQPIVNHQNARDMAMMIYKNLN